MKSFILLLFLLLSILAFLGSVGAVWFFSGSTKFEKTSGKPKTEQPSKIKKAPGNTSSNPLNQGARSVSDKTRGGGIRR